MKNSLFNDFARTDLGPSTNSEPTFNYLNRTARPAFGLVREKIDTWFSNIAENGRDELQARFCSPKETAHYGAFFELYCHALLQSQGYAVELHPDIGSGKQTHPDFLVSLGGEELFYFEVTNAMPSADSQAASARDARLDDAINQLELPDFFVNKSVRTEGVQSPRLGPLRKFLQESAATLNPDDVNECQFARFTYRADDWVIEFSFVAKKPEAREKQDARTLGITSGSVHYPQSHEGIKKSLKKKASKYGDLELPYVIAINCLHEFVDNEDCLAALFGDEQFCIPKPGGASDSSRKQNGFWWGPKGYQNQRVSAVLLANQLVPWTIGSTNSVLWCNPFAKRSFDPSFWQGPQYIPNYETQQLEYLQAIAVPDLLDTRNVSEAIKDESG